MGAGEREEREEREEKMSILIVAIVIGSLIAGVAIWEMLLKAAGGTVVLDGNSWLMKQWRKQGEWDRDPRNLCELFQVVFGFGKVERAADWFFTAKDNLLYSKRVIARAGGYIIDYGLRAAMFLSIVIYTAALLLSATMAVLLAVNAISVDEVTQREAFYLFTGVTVLGTLFAAFTIWAYREGTSWRAFAAKLATLWLRVCPPVTVRTSGGPEKAL